MTTINPAFNLTAEDLELLDEDQFAKLLGAVDRLRRLISAEVQRRRDEARSKYEVLGADATATCLMHRRTVRWMAAPVWWYHDPGVGHPEYRRCTGMWDARAPIVIVERETVEATP